MMKKYFLLLFSAMLFLSSMAQVKSGDAELDKRLAAYMKASEELDFETAVNYLHPKFFSLAPKEAVISAMKSVFESDELEMHLSDVAVVSAEKKSFRSAGSEYRKVSYKMTMSIKLKDTSVYTTEFVDYMTGIYTEQFEGKKVTFDEKKKSFLISGIDILYAIKDAGKQWLFIGFNKDYNMIKKLFPKAVVDHYGMMD